MSDRIVLEHLCMSAKGTTGAGQPLNVSDYKIITVSLATDGGGDGAMTANFQGAISDGATAGITPAFGSAQSVTNMWDYLEAIDMEDGGTKDGDEGIILTAGDHYRLFQINVDGLKYFNVRITAYTEGELTVRVTAFTN